MCLNCVSVGIMGTSNCLGYEKHKIKMKEYPLILRVNWAFMICPGNLTTQGSLISLGNAFEYPPSQFLEETVM